MSTHDLYEFHGSHLPRTMSEAYIEGHALPLLSMPAFTYANGQLRQMPGQMFDAWGNVVAKDKVDLLSRIRALSELFDSGAISLAPLREDTETANRSLQERMYRALFLAREAGSFTFVSRALARVELQDGQDVVSIPRYDARKMYYVPKGFGHSDAGTITLQPLFEAHEEADSPEAFYEDEIDRSVVVLDQAFLSALRATVGDYHAPIAFSGSSLEMLANGVHEVSRTGLPCVTALVPSQWLHGVHAEEEKTTSRAFDGLDLTSNINLLLSGHLGQAYGLSILTDCFRPHHLRVLNLGEHFVLAAPAAAGMLYSQRHQGTTIDAEGAVSRSETYGLYVLDRSVIALYDR